MSSSNGDGSGAAGGEGVTGSGMTASSTPLPPPPTMAINSNAAGITNNQQQQQTAHHSTYSSLPPPPKLNISTASAAATINSASVDTNNNRSANIHISKTVLPPPPTLSFAPPPPPAAAATSASNSNEMIKDGATPRTIALLSEMNDSQQDKHSNTATATVLQSIHSSNEQIPPLSSAPNSGGSILKETTTSLEDLATFTQQVATTIGQTAQEVVFPTTTTKTSYPQPPKPPPSSVRVPALDTPQFGTAAAAAAGGGRKTDNFAMLFGSPTGETTNPPTTMNTTMTTTKSPSAATATATEMKDSITRSMPNDVMMETPDNSAHPLVASAVSSSTPPPPLVSESSSTMVVPPSATSATNSVSINGGSGGLPPRSSPKRKPSSSPSRRSKAVVSTQQQQKQPPSPTKVQQRQPRSSSSNQKRANAQPPLTVLASRQTRHSVLILPTSDAQSIATKNNTTLTELFRVFGNTTPNSTTSNNNRQTTTSNNQELEPPLPPFRSANRSMVITWDQITIDFVSIQDMEGYVPEMEAERALGLSACVWEEDCPNGQEEEEEELKQLELCVVDALKEEEEVERCRREDGIPSMTSKPVSNRKSSTSHHDDDHVDNADSFPMQQEEVLKECADAAISLTSRPNTPWLLRFRHTLDCSTDNIGHEMFRNPSVVILAASTSEPYINCFAELANVHHLPRPYQDGRYDPNGVRREFLLLHDIMDGPKDFDEGRALQRMRERFGPGCCQVLRLNSLSSDPVVVSDGYKSVGESDEWENMGPVTPFVANELSKEYGPSLAYVEDSPIRGACLSPIDKRAIRRYVANMVATGLVPSVERRIANLNTTVTNAKKGVKNVIKSFWRKPKESVSSALSDASGHKNDGNQSNKLASLETAKYRYDSIESQTRLLADTLFLMRDFEAALGIYRLVKDDYKHDKAHLHYASVQEMIVLCMFMIDPSKYTYDVQHSIETALYSYSRAADEEKDDANPAVRPSKAPYATRLATRLCLALSSARTICEGKQMEMADLLASASSHETPLGAAVLLERSSSHYYQADMIRKYSFHMLMAGHMFRSAGQERHAFRCFAASLYVYHGERWGELRSHIHSALAAQLFGMSRFALAMQFYAKLIGSAGGGRVSVRSQQKFLNHLVEICRDQKADALVAVDRMGYNPSDGRDNAPQLSNDFQQIEISNVGFPNVDDSSVRILADGRADSLASNTMGSSGTGDESVWQDMMICAESELRASSISSSNDANGTSGEESNNSNPANSGNEMIDRIISEIDKEEREAEYRERQKRKGNAQTVEVRSTSEPITVSFTLTNPLGVDIELTEMQLVASLSCPKTGELQSNEFSSPEKHDDSSNAKLWKFHGSEKVFERPVFMHQHSIDSDVSESSPVDNAGMPYFVVTKKTVKMTQSSSTVASLEICPLSKGDFKIIGVRFKLLGEVWIYHRFDIPGPLLQDTQLNRSKRVRGESMLLKSKIEEEMPSLKITITPSNKNQSTVLQGQTSSWILTLSNYGYAPAANIMLKTNAPWLNINDETGEEKDENSSTSHCIGPSGTLMKVPFQGTKNTGILQPGETIEVPVFIRTSGGGRQDFYMICRYELWKEDSLISPRHRWARKLLSVPVYPSITMSASLMPSYLNNGEHILSVELMNYRSDRDTGLYTGLNVNFDNLYVISRHFEVKQLQGQVTSDGDSNSLIPVDVDNKPSALEVGWQERVTLHYLVAPIVGTIGPCKISTLPFSNDGSTSLDDVKNGDTKLTDFICRERAHDEFRSTLENHRIEKERLLAKQEKEGQPRHVAQIRRAKTSLPERESNLSSSCSEPVAQPHPTSIAHLCPSGGTSNINVICSWSARVGEGDQNETIVGQHHLRNLSIRPQNKSKGCPLAMTAKHMEKVRHDFDVSPHLDVDVEITLRNRLVETTVDFEFALDDQPEFDFVGSTSFKWSLLGGEEIIVPMKARFYAGGVYNLQSVRLTVLKSEAPIPYLFPLQWRIHVEEDS